MAQSFLGLLLQQLGYSLPHLLVHFVALALSLAFIRRAPGAAFCGLTGSLLLILSAISGGVTRAVIIANNQVPMLAVVNIVTTIFSTAGLICYVTGIFSGRSPLPNFTPPSVRRDPNQQNNPYQA